jgi:hypothetical protein
MPSRDQLGMYALLICSPSDELGANRLAIVLGSWYQFLPHLGSICFPFDFINLKVHKPAFADLLTSQFTRNWREIHPDFSSRTFDTGARVFHPTGVHQTRRRFVFQFCQRADAIRASVHIGGHTFELKFAL